MAGGKMHEHEVEIDDDLVRRLLVAQHPDLADRPIERVASTGTVNALFRLGDDLCVRMPRVEAWSGHLDTELAWLPTLAPHLTLAVPEPVVEGRPGEGYPFRWAVFRWIEGAVLDADHLGDEAQTARDLARFVTEIRAVDPTGAPSSGRRPLRDLDDVTRHAITSSAGAIDVDATLAAWDRCVGAPAWDRTDAVWRHGDLLPPNLLVDRAGHLTAVIDFGSAGIGDPAADVVAAWSVLGAAGRELFRAALDVDDATWSRARGYALHQAALIIPYYPETNPGFVTMAQRTVREVLADL